MATLNADKAMNGQTQALVEAARQMVRGYDPSDVPSMDEVEMATAIGRLTATLTMLIAAVGQPQTTP
jgi:hypothetical protein